MFRCDVCLEAVENDEECACGIHEDGFVGEECTCESCENSRARVAAWGVIPILEAYLDPVKVMELLRTEYAADDNPTATAA